jgi:hypothetical protein
MTKNKENGIIEHGMIIIEYRTEDYGPRIKTNRIMTIEYRTENNGPRIKKRE